MATIFIFLGYENFLNSYQICIIGLNLPRKYPATIASEVSTCAFLQLSNVRPS